MYLVNLFTAVNIQDSVFFASCTERCYTGFDGNTTASIFVHYWNTKYFFVVFYIIYICIIFEFDVESLFKSHCA